MLLILTTLLLFSAHIPLYPYPFLNTTSKTRPFECLRLTSLGVIGAFVKVDDTEVVIEMGSELSKIALIKDASSVAMSTQYSGFMEFPVPPQVASPTSALASLAALPFHDRNKQLMTVKTMLVLKLYKAAVLLKWQGCLQEFVERAQKPRGLLSFCMRLF